MSLNVGLDVFFSSKSLVAVIELADPFLVCWVWTFNILGDVVESDVRVLNGSTDTWLQVEIRD